MRQWLFLVSLSGATQLGCTCTEVKPLPKLAAINAPYTDNFNRSDLGSDWLATDPAAYRIENGELVVRGGYNHPLWLRRPIPKNATIEFTCWSNDDAGDLKVEIWGDGRSHAIGDRTAAYTSTAYNFIFGGWHNQLSALARLNEHGADRKVRQQPPVEKGRRYHWKITRTDGHIAWQIDEQAFLTFDDPQPLEGEGHSFFGFTDWEAELHFDDLTIRPN